MRRLLPLLVLIIACGSQATAVANDFEHLLPPGASVVISEQMDLTGDGKAGWVVGYTLPTKGLPPTRGQAVVFERDSAGHLHAFPLAGTWPGHYPPAFRVTDLTGDGRPELVEQVAGGGAWGMLRVFRRAADSYPLLLEDAAQDHVLWDADGDGHLEIIAEKRMRSQADLRLQRFIWRDGRFVAWHAPEWSYVHAPATGTVLPDLKGLPLQQADQAIRRAGFSLGVIAALDSPGPAGRVIRYSHHAGRVDVAVGAGDTSVRMAELPHVVTVDYHSATEHGIAPIAMTEPQQTRWRNWLHQLVGGVQQAVYTGGLPEGRGPTYVVALAKPWRIQLGGTTQEVRWVGVNPGVPSRGLLYLANEQLAAGYPKFTAAIYTSRAIPPVPVPAEQDLVRYLKANPELDAYVTVWHDEWKYATRLRGIATAGWPLPECAPHLEGTAKPDPDGSPIPDHLMVTVLNGFVRKAVRHGDHVTVEIIPAPGRAYRWALPLTGFDRSTRGVIVHLLAKEQEVATREVRLEGWRDWEGDPGPGSLLPECSCPEE